MQFLAGSGFGEKLVGVAYDPDDKNQEKDIMEATADYVMSQYSKGKGEQVRDIRTKLAKSDEEDGDGKDKVKVVSYDTIINDATKFEKAIKNPNRVISTGEAVKPEDIESGKVERLSKTEVELKDKLTNDLKSRFEGSSFATGSGTKIIQDIKIKYKDGKLLFFPQVNYATAGNDEDLKTLKEYSSGVPLTNERLLKFEKQLKQIAKDSVVSTGVGAKFNQ